MSNKADQRDNAKRHGKEVKIGLAILALLVIALGGVFVKRLSDDGDVPTASIGSGDEATRTSSDEGQSNEQTQPTLLQSQPYSAKTVYNEEAASTDTNWTKRAQGPSTEDDSPTRSLVPQADPSDSSDYDVEQSRIPAGKAIPSNSNIPPAGQDYPTTDHTAETTENSLRQSIPPALASQEAIQTVANRYATPTQATPVHSPVTQQQIPQTYAQSDAYSTSDFQNPAAQAQASSGTADLTAAQDSRRNQSTPAQYTPTQYVVPRSGNNSAQQQQQTQQQQYVPQQYVPRQQQQLTPMPVESSPVVRGKTHVQPGETMWAISRRVYGSNAFFKAISEHNRQRLPNSHDLKIGDEVLTPEVAVLRRRYPGLCPRERKRKPGTPGTTIVSTTMIRAGRTYVVEEGDTLYDIARYELGAGAHWPQIFQLNRRTLGEDFDYLKPGTKLTLPARAAKQSGDALAERPTQRITR